jgi:hypothetical protein
MADLGIDDFVMVDKDGSSLAPSTENGGGDFLPAISKHIAELSSELRKISLDLHDHPELKYHETHAHEILTRYMDSKPGWKVTRHVYGIETAFVAVYDSGREGPAVSFNAEYGKQAVQFP